jgi:mRNA interferase RelE/StbE
MGVNFEIRYHTAVVREDIPKLAQIVRDQIKHAIEKKLTTFPDQYGKPLRRSLKGYRKLRVGDYRVIFRIDGKIVKIFIIQHRSVVYKKSKKRIHNI